MTHYGIISTQFHNNSFSHHWVTLPDGDTLIFTRELDAHHTANDLTDAARAEGILNQDYRARRFDEAYV